MIKPEPGSGSVGGWSPHDPPWNPVLYRSWRPHGTHSEKVPPATQRLMGWRHFKSQFFHLCLKTHSRN